MADVFLLDPEALVQTAVAMGNSVVDTWNTMNGPNEKARTRQTIDDSASIKVYSREILYNKKRTVHRTKLTLIVTSFTYTNATQDFNGNVHIR